jgi:hypothetical protein
MLDVLNFGELVAPYFDPLEAPRLPLQVNSTIRGTLNGCNKEVVIKIRPAGGQHPADLSAVRGLAVRGLAARRAKLVIICFY